MHLWYRLGDVSILSTWYIWCLTASWILAFSYLLMTVRHPENAIGLFLLPLVLLLIALAVALRNEDPFPRDRALEYWRMTHGIALLLGTVVASFGFAAGVMYLIKEQKLKRKSPPQQGIRLPSLEWLLLTNRSSLMLSTILLLLGLVSGVVLNARQDGSVPWNDPVVLWSGVLFAWLAAASIFELIYRPAREGHKVAYLTLASFVFLGLAFASVVLSDHGGDNAASGAGQAVIWRADDGGEL
jgi:ABC-type uncharacterized transport system permease subunit